MGFSTFPNNPFPPSSAQFDEGKNELSTKTNLSNIAPAFDATSGVYAVGDKVVYNGVLYQFTTAHSTAGEWDESEVQPVKVSELIDSLKSGLTSLKISKDELAYAFAIPNIPTSYPCNWIAYDLLIITARQYSNRIVSIVVPVSYFAVTTNSNRVLLLDTIFNRKYAIYKNGESTVYMECDNPGDAYGIIIEGIKLAT